MGGKSHTNTPAFNHVHVVYVYSVNEDALDQIQQELCDAVANLVPKVPLHISSTIVQEQLAHWNKQVVIHFCFLVTVYYVSRSNFRFR